MLWFARILAILGVLAAADAAFASVHAPVPVLASVVGAVALSALGTAMLWMRPLVAAALGWMWLTLTFAAGAIAAGSVDAAGAPAFTNISGGDSAALVVAAAAAFAALAGIYATRNGIVRAVIGLLALYVIVPTVASIGHGGLTAALTSGPFAQSKGAYAGAEILLPLGAVCALAFALIYVAKKRGVDSAIALVIAVALLGATNLGAYTAGLAQLPTIVAFEHPQPSGATAALPGAASPAGAVSPPGELASAVPAAAWQTADAAQREIHERTVPTLVLGVAQVDDGIISLESYSSKAAGAVNAAAQAFGTAAPATPDPFIQKLRKAEDAIPAREYSLDELAATLPNDVGALYDFVRDNVGTDIYAGSMRGPLGAWMNRAANSADKARLLAWLLAKKGIAARFERGTLSDAERGQLAQAASSAQRPIVPPSDDVVARYINARANAGASFASWATAKLRAGGVALGTGAIDASRVPSRHYWVRVYANGKQLDLDPALVSLQAGQHLGTQDAAFKESPTFPADDTMFARVRLIAKRGGGETILAEKIGAIPDLAYSPLLAGIAPQTGNANALQTAIVFGTAATAGKPISTVPAEVPDSLVLQVDRATGAGSTVTVRRTIFDRKNAGANAAQAMIGLHTIVLAPGSAPMFFERENFRVAEVLAENNAAEVAGKAKPFGGLYPLPLAAFLIRDDVLAATLGTRGGIRLFRDRPDLVMLHTTAGGSSGSATGYRTIFDIADNGMNAIGSSDALTAANLARGWGDTWIEKDLLGPGSTGAMTTWLANKKTGTYTVARGMTDDLSPTDVALTASRGAQWWDVDPATSNVVGRLPGGWGPEIEEESTLAQQIQSVYEAWEIEGTAKECIHGGEECITKICELGISGALFVHSRLAGAVVLSAVAAEIVFSNVAGMGCPSKGGGEGGGEGGGGGNGGGGEHGGGGNGGGGGTCDEICSPEDPSQGDGTGP